jgi:thiamine biosynthesis lipoprotein
MGTSATLATYSESRRSGLVSLESVAEVLERTESELSTWREESVLSALNRQPVHTPFSAETLLCQLLGELFRWHEQTDGAFDPAVGRLIDAWGLRAEGRHPGPDELALARRKSGLEHLELVENDSGCTLRRLRDITIDAGAFGKGEGLDRVLAFSEPRQSGELNAWMIGLGGQVMVHGSPPGQRGWEVSLAHPRTRSQPVRTLVLVSGSLATSGGSENDLQFENERLGHVLDPRSGQTIVSDGSVVVWHESALVADILSTALYVMGPDEGLAWAEKNGIAASFLTPRGDTVSMRSSSQFEETFPEID